MSAITIENLTKDYGSVRALNAVSLSIHEGEIFGLLGPNGAGKTTLIKIITTLLKPSGGNVRVLSFDAENESFKVRNCLGYSPQDIALDKYQTTRQILRMIGIFYHLHGKELDQAINEALDVVKLRDYADTKTRKFSGGMKKRLEIASALLHRPQLLILDEPTLGLDIETRYEIWHYINQINKRGTTVLLTTHYLEEAEQLCHRIAIIDHGFLKVVGNPEMLRGSVGDSILKIKFTSSFYNELDNISSIGQELVTTVSKTLTINDVIYDNTNKNLLIKLPHGIDDVENIIASLKESKLFRNIESFSVSKPSLSDVYLNYIQAKQELSAEIFLNGKKQVNVMEV